MDLLPFLGEWASGSRGAASWAKFGECISKALKVGSAGLAGGLARSTHSPIRPKHVDGRPASGSTSCRHRLTHLADLRSPWADQPHVRPDHARRSTRDRGGQVAQQAVGDVPGYTRRPTAQACLLPRSGLLNAPVVEAKPFELWGGAGPPARSAKGRGRVKTPRSFHTLLVLVCFRALRSIGSRKFAKNFRL
jgi:hypothetical protein